MSAAVSTFLQDQWCMRAFQRIGRSVYASPCRRLQLRSLHGTTSPGHVSPSGLSHKAHCAPFPAKSHKCSALSTKLEGSRVILTGWLLSERKLNSISFYPLRDASGTIQLLMDASKNAELADALSQVPVESTVVVEGTVVTRPLSAQRPVPGGDVDVHIEAITVLNPADTEMPFVPSMPKNLPNEDFRLRYRYLDLRRPILSDNLKKRSQVAHIARDTLHGEDFVEVETPLLLRSSPEGAREFLVPTRTSPGDSPAFYALSQSPQQPKQLLVCSGAVEKYYQIAKCFRDEDGRKDRQPEFTQIDLEMAFVSWGNSNNVPTSTWSDEWRIGGTEVRDVVEKLIRRVWQEVKNVTLEDTFKVMTYNEAMSRFGSDKPDVRFGFEIMDLSASFPEDIQSALTAQGEMIEGILINKEDREWHSASKHIKHEPGVERLIVSNKTLSLSVANSEILRSLPLLKQDDAPLFVKGNMNLQPGDTLWLSKRARKPKGGSTDLGRLRLQLLESALSRGYQLSEEPHFLWITEFPLFTRSDADKDFLAHGRWSSSHHPFTAPMWQDIEAMYAGKIEDVRGQHYDLVLNGMEIGGGSVRVHDAQMQDYIFSQVLQLTEDEKMPFAQLLQALRCGAPPHGGIALGFDRLMSILCNTTSIRDIIAFPKTSLGTDPLFKSPTPVRPEVLKEYGIKPLH